MNTTDNLKLYYERQSEIYRMHCIESLLDWDQQVYMPPRASQARSQQIELIALEAHKRKTDPEFGRVVDGLYEALDTLMPDDQVNIREAKRVLDIQRKLPEDYVAEMSRAGSMGYSTWAAARPKNDFSAVHSYLEKIVELARRRCELVGYEDQPYDALLDIYEPGAKTAQVKPLLLKLAQQLREIIPPITDKFGKVEEPSGHYDRNLQQQLGKRVSERLGFSFEQGRIDTTAHPFMTTLGPADFRITTRYEESDFISGLYSTIHETGHALYELGLPPEWAGTPRGAAVSLGIHESQSRLWENIVGRSREFSTFLSRVVSEFFPDQAPDSETLWWQVNRVHPSLIRTEADEVTYSQHVVIRMLLEISLINGELTVDALPQAWNDMYEEYLGVRPTNYKDGVMQDVHWYSGSIGYFPTYALGNLYGAMMMNSIREAIPELPGQIERGEFTDILDWLRRNVHSHGMRFRGPELIKNITGKELSEQPFVDYLREKYL